MSYACVNLVGHIGRVELKESSASKEVYLQFSLAVNARDKESQPTWYTCFVWGRRASALAPHLTKGVKVAVTGALEVIEKENRFFLQVRVAELEWMSQGTKEPGKKVKEVEDPFDSTEIPF